MIWIHSQDRKKIGFVYHIDFGYYEKYYISGVDNLERFELGVYSTREKMHIVRAGLLEAIKHGDKMFVMPKNEEVIE